MGNIGRKRRDDWRPGMLAKRKSLESYVTKRDTKIHWHESFICEKNGKKKRIEIIQAFEIATMSEGTRKRRTERATVLAERFTKNSRSFEKCVWQDEKDFTLEVPLNPENICVCEIDTKHEAHDNRFHQGNKKSRKVTACLTWNSAAKPFFVNDKGLEVNTKTYQSL